MIQDGAKARSHSNSTLAWIWMYGSKTSRFARSKGEPRFTLLREATHLFRDRAFDDYKKNASALRLGGVRIRCAGFGHIRSPLSESPLSHAGLVTPDFPGRCAKCRSFSVREVRGRLASAFSRVIECRTFCS